MKKGKTRIYPNTNRTLEGTLGAIFSSMIAYFLISIVFEVGLYKYFFKLLVSFLFGFLYEGLTLDIDNLTLPIFIYRIYILFEWWMMDPKNNFKIYYSL